MKDTRGRSNGTYARGIMNGLGCVQKKNGAGGANGEAIEKEIRDEAHGERDN